MNLRMKAYLVYIKYFGPLYMSTYYWMVRALVLLLDFLQEHHPLSLFLLKHILAVSMIKSIYGVNILINNELIKTLPISLYHPLPIWLYLPFDSPKPRTCSPINGIKFKKESYKFAWLSRIRTPILKNCDTKMTVISWRTSWLRVLKPIKVIRRVVIILVM